MAKLIYPSGSWVAIVTPFDESGKLNLGVMRDLVDFHAANGTSTLLIMGSTGEPTLLSMDERHQIIREMAAYCKGKIHAFFGVTNASTEGTIALARYVQEHDGDGIVITVPPYICPDQASVHQYLVDVCRSVDISVGIYNNPARVVANINPDTIIRLFNEVPNLVADKEAMPSVGQIVTVHEGTKGKLPVLCCDSPVYALTLPVLAVGGSGTANVSGNIHPKLMAEMSQPWTSWDDVLRTREAYKEMLPIMEACYAATNPIAVKSFVRLLGFPVGQCRKPLPDASSKIQEGMKALINAYDLKKIYGLK